jgi:hypothetical protein
VERVAPRGIDPFVLTVPGMILREPQDDKKKATPSIPLVRGRSNKQTPDGKSPQPSLRKRGQALVSPPR